MYHGHTGALVTHLQAIFTPVDSTTETTPPVDGVAWAPVGIPTTIQPTTTPIAISFFILSFLLCGIASASPESLFDSDVSLY